MRTKVIATFPQYTGIFLNKDSKLRLLNKNDNNIIKPMYNKRFGHHITINFNPGTTINIKWGAKIELKILRHIYDNNCQIVEVIPISAIYKDINSDSTVTVTDLNDIFKLLSCEPRKLYVTISTKGQSPTGDKITHEYSQILLDMSSDDYVNAGVTSVDLADKKLILSGFCGMYVDAIAEKIRPNRKFSKKSS